MPAAWQPPDLDEIRPDRFVVNNEKVRPFLRGEGEREGVFFRLLSSRREGWVARLRMAGFNVRTLDDRVRTLPAVRRDLALGPAGVRRLSTARERIAGWDAAALRWRDLPVALVDGVPSVQLRVHEPLRRRKSRSGGDFFVAVAERPEQIGLRPVKETEAVMQAYSLLASSGRAPLLRVRTAPDRCIVPANQALLPQPHREAVEHLALDEGEPWTFGAGVMPLVEEVFNRLGIRLILPASE